MTAVIHSELEMVLIEPVEGFHECAKCRLGATWDGGYQKWVHWWNGKTQCPDSNEPPA